MTATRVLSALLLVIAPLGAANAAPPASTEAAQAITSSAVMQGSGPQAQSVTGSAVMQGSGPQAQAVTGSVVLVPTQPAGGIRIGPQTHW